MTFVIPYPIIDPVLFQFGPILGVGPFMIRWYALSYVFGLLGSWWYMRWMAARSPRAATKEDIDDLITWGMLGVVLGGRIGHVLFYGLGYYLQNPLEALQVWKGGMSFHGGFLGVVVVGVLFARKRGINVLSLADLITCAAPIGLFLGRIANFINGELWGRTSGVPWAMVFPRGGAYPRHPSQLYEAMLEGLLLFVILHLLWRREPLRLRPGFLTGVFLAGYSVFRSFGELFREPSDGYVGFLTAGQALSLPMLLLGLYLVFRRESGRKA